MFFCCACAPTPKGSRKPAPGIRFGVGKQIFFKEKTIFFQSLPRVDWLKKIRFVFAKNLFFVALAPPRPRGLGNRPREFVSGLENNFFSKKKHFFFSPCPAWIDWNKFVFSSKKVCFFAARVHLRPAGLGKPALGLKFLIREKTFFFHYFLLGEWLKKMCFSLRLRPHAQGVSETGPGNSFRGWKTIFFKRKNEFFS